MLWKLPSNKKLLLGILLVIGIATVFYFLIAKNAEKTVKQTLLQRQQLLVRAESSNISSFFQVFGDSVAVLAQLPATSKLDSDTAKSLDIFVEQWRQSKVVSGIALLDEDGLVKFNSNIEGTHDTGASLSDRDYYLWAKDESNLSEYFIGKPVVSKLGASKGKTIVPVAAGIYKDGVFKGMLVASVRLNLLTEHYLELIKASEATEVYLIDQMGNIIYEAGTTTDILVRDRLFSDNLKEILNDKKEGKLETGEHLLAYSNVGLNNQDWLLVMATPREEVSNFTAPIFMRLSVMVVLVSITIFLYGFIHTTEIPKVVSATSTEEIKK